MAKTRSGWIVLGTKFAAKAGGKLLGVLAKLFKGAKVGKLASVGISMGAWSLLFSWKFALLIMLLLIVHESGHVFAMRQTGMRTKGIYFIPLLGAAAVADEAFPSRKAETYIALMGPIWGGVLSLAFLGVWHSTQIPLLAAVASWMALVNLFNLIPIVPLDGGRVLKSVICSLRSWKGLAYFVFAVGLLGTGILIAYTGLWWILFLFILGSFELFMEYRKGGSRQKSLTNSELAVSVSGYLLLAGFLYFIMRTVASIDGAKEAFKIFVG